MKYCICQLEMKLTDFIKYGVTKGEIVTGFKDDPQYCPECGGPENEKERRAYAEKKLGSPCR